VLNANFSNISAISWNEQIWQMLQIYLSNNWNCVPCWFTNFSENVWKQI